MNLTPAVLSKLPLGLLGFFGIKNGGQYPQTLLAHIQPVLEQLPLLCVNYHENIVGNLIAAGLGFQQQNAVVGGLPLIVPPGEIWRVNHFTSGPFTGAGDSITFTAGVQSRQNGSASAWNLAIAGPFTQGASLSQVLPNNYGPFWVGPGDIFGYWVSALVNASGTTQVTSNVSITRFPF